MYVPAEPGVMERFGVGNTAAALGLAIYVMGYGVGPLLFAPMSEIPLFGRKRCLRTDILPIRHSVYSNGCCG